MKERNCKDCIYNSYAHDGCCAWDCNFISRTEAARAVKKAREEQAKKESE